MDKELTPNEVWMAAIKTLAEAEESRRLEEGKSERRISSRGYEKLFAYYLDKIDTDYFQKTVADLRKEFGIPEEGFISDDFSLPPEGWVYAHDASRWQQLFKIEQEICHKYGLSWNDWGITLEAYIFYNQKRQFDYGGSHNLCIVSDLVKEHEHSLSRERKIDEDTAYPIAIRISPYAGRRDIEDFVSQVYSIDIKPLQDKYKDPRIKIGRVRRKDRDIAARNAFIYKNRHLSRKEIGCLIVEEGWDQMDVGHIGKVISLEQKRRKEL